MVILHYLEKPFCIYKQIVIYYYMMTYICAFYDMNMINWLPFLNHKYEMLLKIMQITARVAAILDLCKLTIVPGLGFPRTFYMS